MAHTVHKQRIVGNPGSKAFGAGRPKSKRATAGRGAPSSNPGRIIGFTLGSNPGRKASKTMAKTAKKTSHKPTGYGKPKHHAKGNPGHKGGHSHHKGFGKTRPQHRNPGNMTKLGPLVTNAAFAIVGALGSKLGAQMILGTNNVGWVGYAGNAGVGFALYMIAEKMLRNTNAAMGLATGTVIQLIIRAINDYTPLGSYVSQLGMGDYQIQSFVTPQILVDPLTSAEIQIPDGWAPKMLPQPAPAPAAGKGGSAAAGMGSLYGTHGGGLYSAA